MKADLTKLTETKRNIEHYRREAGFSNELSALDPATGRAIVTARIYQPGTTAYCVLWVWGDKRQGYGRGLGKAGGYGYHKASAALSEAALDAGVKLSDAISGHGSGAMRDAVEAIAKAASGKRRLIIHEAHA